MGTSDLPDMYAQNPRAQANHECPCYKCYVTLPVRLNANTRVISEFFIYTCLNNSIMVKCG